MVALKVKLRVLKDLNEVINFNGYKYKAFKCAVSVFESIVLVSERSEVKAGDCLQITEGVLTHAKIKGVSELAFKAKEFVQINPEEYTPEEHVEVSVIGKLIKTKKARLRKVTDRGLDFIPCSLVIRNEVKERMSVLLVAFKDNAVELDKVKPEGLIKVNARFSPMKFSKGYELNVSSFEVVAESNSDKRSKVVKNNKTENNC